MTMNSRAFLDDLGKWADNGADYNDWDLTPFVKDIELLLDAKSLNYILLDYPFAYLHHDVSDLINVAFYIDTPLDIAMARRLLRDFRETANERVHEELEAYLAQGRSAYLVMDEKVKPNSDFIIDGLLSLDIITKKIIEKIGEEDAK